MKSCSYCGRENPAEALHCPECGTAQERSDAGPSTAPAVREYEFAGLSAEESQQDLVTLLRCRTLADADLVVSRLTGSGIKALIPDEFVMQTACWNLNTYGYVRVQIPRGDYPAAVELLTAPAFEGELGSGAPASEDSTPGRLAP